MYCGDRDFESSTLRQGDILSQVHVLGAINLGSIQYNVQYGPGNQQNTVGFMVPRQARTPINADVMVLSHSCEIAKENGVKLTSIILAPIRDINGATEPGKIQELIDTNIVEDATEASYLKYFYVPPNDKLENKSGAIVDFSKCFSVRKNSYEHLLSKKILQLAPPFPDRMAKKLALYFYRTKEAEETRV